LDILFCRQLLTLPTVILPLKKNHGIVIVFFRNMFSFQIFLYNFKKIIMNYVEYNLKLGYRRVADKTFVPLCQGVISSLKNNTNYPDIDPLIINLETVFTDYLVSIPAKQDLSPARSVIKDSKKEVVKLMMRTIGFHCLSVANNDLEKLKSTGFPTAKTGGSSTPVEMPMPVIRATNSNGIPNQLIVKCMPSRAVKLYDIRVSTDEQNWSTTTNNNSEVKVNNLPTEVVLYVQLRYRHGDHTTPWSPITQTRIFNSSIAIPLAN
jgi:hypothetical protein